MLLKDKVAVICGAGGAVGSAVTRACEADDEIATIASSYL